MTPEEAETEILAAAIALARARLVHESAKSDPSHNVATGQAAYEAEKRFHHLMNDLFANHREIIDQISSKTRQAT